MFLSIERISLCTPGSLCQPAHICFGHHDTDDPANVGVDAEPMTRLIHQVQRWALNAEWDAVQVGDAVPAVTLYGATPGDKVDLAEHVGSKTVVMFGVPGAFTPGCSKVRPDLAF